MSFAVELPVSLEFALDLGKDAHRFVADIRVPLVLTARARQDLAIVLDIIAPRASEVNVVLKAEGLRASITKHAANVEGGLRRFIAKYVARELGKDYVSAACLVDVSGAIDRGMQTLGPRSPGGDKMTSDLDEALAAEILKPDLPE